ncbi:MAG: glutamate--tRNA ligase [Desulfobacterales bacterium]|nr:glutamate--tRNA ligase [Desulfobacterales bacterium]
MKSVITRFPPSPSGYLHVGGARTALFNWLYARHMQGKFVVRIEDTDTQRSTQASIDAIFEALEWLGIDWDEGPFFQSKRLAIYAEYLQKLIDTGRAYYCTCSPEAIEAMRQKATATGGKPKYDGTCRKKGLEQKEGAVIRFKSPLTGTTVMPDLVKGNIVFQNSELDDFIICRSDGMPTYNFAVVVDDITMEINTVIRGDDHVNNTPKQILLFLALNCELPDFAHVPMVLGQDRSRLSKRHGAMSVTAYRDMGFLPEAVNNYLVRLGWSYGDQEFFTPDELIAKFNLENIGRSPGIFDTEKMLAFNADHIKAASPSKLIPHLMPFLKAQESDIEKGPDLEKIIPTLSSRSKTLIEMAEGAQFYFAETIQYETKAAKKFLKEATNAPLAMLADELEKLDVFDEKHLENAFKNVMMQTGLKLGKIAQPVRVALTGTTVSPGIFEIIDVLGKKRVLQRLRQALAFIQNGKQT